jgi:hypothetical protein
LKQKLTAYWRRCESAELWIPMKPASSVRRQLNPVESAREEVDEVVEVGVGESPGQF